MYMISLLVHVILLLLSSHSVIRGLVGHSWNRFRLLSPRSKEKVYNLDRCYAPLCKGSKPLRIKGAVAGGNSTVVMNPYPSYSIIELQ